MAPILSVEETKSFLKSKRYLLSTPNVVSLGFINEKIDGNKTGAKIFRVGVIKKQSKEIIKDPDIFVPEFFEHIKSNSNEVVHIPVKVVEEGELESLALGKDANTGNDAPYKGATLIKIAQSKRIGCLGANAQYQGTYRLLSAAHVLTNFDPDYIGNEILVENNKGEYVKIDATVSGHVDVVLYNTRTEPCPEYAKQDLAWADITEREGSPEIQKIGIPTTIRSVKHGERVKYYGGYSTDRGNNVEVEDIMALAKLKISIPSAGIKYGYFRDVCRINPEESRLDKGDSGTAIVAEDDNALLGILIAKANSTYYFCKLELES